MMTDKWKPQIAAQERNKVETEKHGHYKKDVSHLKVLDVYRVLDLYQVTHPAIQHAIKKLLAAGGRGAKNDEQDVREAIDSLHRWLQMRAEDCA